MTTKRVCELVVGDVFTWCNHTLIVYKFMDDRVYYRNYVTYKNRNGGAASDSFGDKNKMKVEFLWNEPKRNYTKCVTQNV